MQPGALPQLAAVTNALVDVLGSVLGDRLGTTVEVSPVPGPIDPAWSTTVSFSTSSTPRLGFVTIGIARSDGILFAQELLGQAEPLDEAIIDLLQKLFEQAIEALHERPEVKGVLLGTEAVSAVTTPPEGASQFYVIRLSPEVAPSVGLWTAVEPAGASASTVPSGRLGQTSGIDGPPRATSADQSRPRSTQPANLDVILDIDLPLSVRFGQTTLTIEALSGMGPGSLIDLGRSPDEPVDLLVNGSLVARAEVVVVRGNYGVRILEVVSAADRIRSLGP